MTTPVSFDNRFFSATWSAIARREPQEIKELRAENLRGLTGHVLEVGAGIGSNFLLYPNTVTAVTALEPESRLRPQAEGAAAGAAIPVTVTAGVFEDLAVTGEDRFDAVVCSLVLCSVGDPDRAAAQAFEVLKPGGEVRFFEHVAHDGALGLVQRAVDATFWPKLFGNCHTHRDTLAAIERAGFTIEERRDDWLKVMGIPMPSSSIVIGRAVKPA
ncbi:methyltransferase family protein [Mycobacteroides abscessus subsp. bolletii]|uniref:class I SAM-dependent methyltransferase n=1 Tax=Mycobacteroides abscessus TaxID=36809 RepID=UPI00092A9224|nr:class I SAM-dependent methyltransferase [Mycobacteroides abscessus]SHY07527.1 methyltransferase family protein [Mycobacteroides abscessus subsp. bolletii]SKP71873.1 methyltransferase family protein [Mycobacteroides abscessus subsp. bolletii]SKQ06306.1 methyltransferase family protein [Mycobacteroides abscessus subsp. bolletii]SKQ09441.1 methyltransferase family protein [Mycobacteroides abscessus subsp. bolletii]SKU47116.1 methyltransferase family protein [Mycobacteroides abscessus subsp. bo